MIALGAEAVVFGPGNIREAHRTGEFVPVSELNQCVEILQRPSNVFACKRAKVSRSGNRPRNAILESNVIIVGNNFLRG